MSAYLGNKKVNVGVYIETDRVVLSAAEYAALPVKDPNTMYLVYDDPLLVEVAKHMEDEDVHVTAEEKENIKNHINDTDIHITIEEKEKLNTPADSPIPLYLSLLTDNATIINAALGKNNEDKINNVGQALAMYAWFQGSTSKLENLQKCNTVNDICNSRETKTEIIQDSILLNFVLSGNYISEFIPEYLTVGEFNNDGKNHNSATYNIELSQDDIDNKMIYFYVGGAKNGTTLVGSDTNYVRISLNDVNIFNWTYGEINTPFEKYLDLSDYNITQAGSYNLVVAVGGLGYYTYIKDIKLLVW